MFFYINIFITNFIVQNRILPENADEVINAQITFSKYKQEGSTIKEREIANTLEKLFMCNTLQKEEPTKKIMILGL